MSTTPGEFPACQHSGVAQPDDPPSRNYRGATGEERVARRRAALIDAGIEVFGSTGFRASSVDEVCAVAGLTKRYFYESFSDREDLLIASYRAASDALLATLATTVDMPAATVEERVDAFVRTLFDVCHSQPQMARVLLLEIVGVSDRITEAHRASTDRYIDLVLQIGSDLAPLNDLNERTRYLLGASLVGAALQLLREWVLLDFATDREEQIDVMRFITVAVIERVIATSGSTVPR